MRTLRDKAGQATLRELVIGLREPHNPIRVYASNIADYPPPNAKLALTPLSDSMRVNAKASSHICRLLTTCPSGMAFSFSRPLRIEATVIMATHYGFCLTRESRASRPAQLPPDKIKLGDLRLV